MKKILFSFGFIVSLVIVIPLITSASVSSDSCTVSNFVTIPGTITAGDPVTIFFDSKNCDKVIVSPFGQLKDYEIKNGKKMDYPMVTTTYKLSAYKNGKIEVTNSSSVIVKKQINALISLASNPTINKVVMGQKGVSLGSFQVANKGPTLDALEFGFYGTAPMDTIDKVYLYSNNKLIKEGDFETYSALNIYNEVTGIRTELPKARGYARFYNLKLATPKTFEVRVDISPKALSFNLGVNVSALLFNGYSFQKIDNVSAKLVDIAGKIINLTPALDLTPRIAYDDGYVNQHIDLNKKVWVTDPDERSGANIDSVDYCKKWYPKTTSYRYYKDETIDNWHQGAGRMSSGLSTQTVMTIECVSSPSQPILSSQLNSECQPATLKYDSGTWAYFSYKIIEPKSPDGCKINLKYIDDTKPEFKNKDMTCVFDNKIDIRQSLSNVIIGASKYGTLVCSGPLYSLWHVSDLN